MRLWRAGVLVLVATIALVLALTLAGAGNGLALLVYVLFLAAVLFALLVARLRTALPAAPSFEALLARPKEHQSPVEQFDTIRRRVAMGSYSEAELYSRLRPLVRDIVAARLSRRYSVDLEREPERARALVGEGRVWELARPDRTRPSDQLARGWSERELEQLVEELESL
jgi:hypothetical protein